MIAHGGSEAGDASRDGDCPIAGAPLSTREGHGRCVLWFKHGLSGVAPNAIELQPILGFHCLTV
jgi:hypothetical protein